jgi:hypothetical protein
VCFQGGRDQRPGERGVNLVCRPQHLHGVIRPGLHVDAVPDRQVQDDAVSRFREVLGGRARHREDVRTVGIAKHPLNSERVSLLLCIKSVFYCTIYRVLMPIHLALVSL